MLVPFLSDPQALEESLLLALMSRLFRNRSLGSPHEKAICSTIGQQLGPKFRQRVQDMLEDVWWSQKYSSALQLQEPALGNFSVLLAADYVWPVTSEARQWKVNSVLHPCLLTLGRCPVKFSRIRLLLKPCVNLKLYFHKLLFRNKLGKVLLR